MAAKRQSTSQVEETSQRSTGIIVPPVRLLRYFEVESSAWMEFSVYGKKYGMLAEGGERKLIFQDSRYLRFERTIYNKK